MLAECDHRIHFSGASMRPLTLTHHTQIRPTLILLMTVLSVSINGSFKLGDFDGDGHADMLLRHEEGAFTCSTSVNREGNVEFAPVVGLEVTFEWHLAALIDLDGDAKTDLLFRHRDLGWVFAPMDGCKLKSDQQTVRFDDLTSDSRIVGVIDVDGNQTDELVTRNDHGAWSVVFLNDGTVVSTVDNPTGLPIDTNFAVIDVGDFDNDSRTDILSRHANGTWYLHSQVDSTRLEFVTRSVPFQLRSDWRDEATGDFDGDGQGDVLLRHATGMWEIQTLIEGDEESINAWVPFGLPTEWHWRAMAAGDLDGDGRDDLVLFDNDTRRWSFSSLTKNATTGEVATSFLTDSEGGLNVPQPTIYFPDLVLRKVVKERLQLESRAWITASDLDDLRSLFLQHSDSSVLVEKIKDLRGLRAAHRLTGLELNGQGIQFLTPLIGLNLQAISLERNQIEDVTSIADMTELTSLNLRSNVIVDVTSLKKLVELRSLDLAFNVISDLSALISLAHLRDLSLSANKIDDIAPLQTLTKLTFLYMNDNVISDVSPLESLTQLEYLQLGSNRIDDITSFSSLTSLRHLNARVNRIRDLSPIKSHTQIEYLNLSGNEIVEISPLATMTKLNRLDLSHNAIEVLDPLNTLTQLEMLNLRSNKISDISALKSLTQLVSLDLSNNEIVDIAPLATLAKMKRLDLSSNGIEEISPLDSLIHLEFLDLGSNKIVDISPLAELTKLKQLNLTFNSVSDISPLQNLTQLQNLDLANNEIHEIDILLSLAELKEVVLSGNRLSDNAWYTVVPQLRARGVEVEANAVLHTFRDSRGRATTWTFDTDAATEEPNALLIHFHGNVTATARDVVMQRLPWVKSIAHGTGLVSVVIASPESWSTREPWRSPNMDGDGTRFWNYLEDVDLVHEMLQTDFDGKLAVDKDRVYLFGTSQGTCFLHPFLNRWGRYYRGGLLADCGCVDVDLSPIWHADPETIENFRVFVRAATGDFLHRPSTIAYNYYKYVLGLETYGDLRAEGGHCAEGDISRSKALRWLTNSDDLDGESEESAHFTRISLLDRVVGIATDTLGALWVAQQERTGDDPRASLWRSVDRGNSFEMIARHPFEVYDVDSIGDEVFITTAEGPIFRSSDHGLTFDAVVVDDSPTQGWIRGPGRRILGRPNVQKRPGMIGTRSGTILMPSIVNSGSNSDSSLLMSKDGGRSWRTEETPLRLIRDHAIGPDPIVFDDENGYLYLSDPVTWIAEIEQLRWYEVDEPPGPLRSTAWSGNELIGYSWGEQGRIWWSASGPAGIWREKSFPNAVTATIGRAGLGLLTAIDQGDVLLFGYGSEGHLYNGLENSWVHVRGGTFISPQGMHKVAVDAVRGDVFVSGARGVFRLDARFRDGLRNIEPIDDRDGDLIPDALDRFPENPTEYLDTDQDGVGNATDSDDDGDNVLDRKDAAPLDPGATTDLDLDGIGDYADYDVDGDGFSNKLDVFPLDEAEFEDTDGDGIGNWEDRDDDNDGVPDVLDAFPRYSFEQGDQDGDFIGDGIDPDPENSTLESQSQLTVAYGNWLSQKNVIQLNKEPRDGVIYPEPLGETRYYGRLKLGDGDTSEVDVMMSIFSDEYREHLYLDRNDDDDLTNDGGPIQLKNGSPQANWYEIWVEVTYRSGIKLPYHIPSYSFRAVVRSLDSSVMHLMLPPSAKATRITLPNGGPSVSLAIVDANANAVFNDDVDYVCVDANDDRRFDHCGVVNGAEHFPYGETIIVDEISYSVETNPSGYSITVNAMEDSASAINRTTHTPYRYSHANEPIRDERELTTETFYSPTNTDPIGKRERLQGSR